MPLKVLDVCVPIADKVGIPLAMENHKDRVVDEEVEVLKKYSSANFGALVDFGNNISMCDDPVDVVTKLAPYVKSCHMKNMGVQNYATASCCRKCCSRTASWIFPRCGRC